MHSTVPLLAGARSVPVLAVSKIRKNVLKAFETVENCKNNSGGGIKTSYNAVAANGNTDDIALNAVGSIQKELSVEYVIKYK